MIQFSSRLYFIKVDLQWGQFKSMERKYKTFTSVDYGIQAYPP